MEGAGAGSATGCGPAPPSAPLQQRQYRLCPLPESTPPRACACGAIIPAPRGPLSCGCGAAAGCTPALPLPPQLRVRAVALSPPTRPPCRWGRRRHPPGLRCPPFSHTTSAPRHCREVDEGVGAVERSTLPNYRRRVVQTTHLAIREIDAFAGSTITYPYTLDSGMQHESNKSTEQW